MISIRSTLRATFARFLLSGAALIGLGVVALALSGPLFWGWPATEVTGLSPRAPVLLLIEMASAAIGYGIALSGLRRRLRSDSPIEGRPSLVAGMAAPVAIMLSTLAIPHSILAAASVSGVIGGSLALGMFWPWLERVASKEVIPGEASLAASATAAALNPMPIDVSQFASAKKKTEASPVSVGRRRV